jgi:hypothetical protein
VRHDARGALARRRDARVGPADLFCVLGDTNDQQPATRSSIATEAVVSCGACGKPLAPDPKREAICEQCGATNALSHAVKLRFQPAPSKHTFTLLYQL